MFHSKLTVLIAPLFLSLFFATCRTKQDVHYEKLNLEIFDTLAFSYFEPFIDKKKLDKINTGYDSLQLRIWYLFSFSDSIDLFTIKNDREGEWTASWERFFSNFEGENIPRIIQINDGQIIWKKLKSRGLLNFPGMTTEKLGRYCDGEIVVIEIASHNYYRRVCSQASMAYHSKNDASEVKKANELLEAFWEQLELENKIRR